MALRTGPINSEQNGGGDFFVGPCGGRALLLGKRTSSIEFITASRDRRVLVFHDVRAGHAYEPTYDSEQADRKCKDAHC